MSGQNSHTTPINATEINFYSQILIDEETTSLQQKGQSSHPGQKGRSLSPTRGSTCARSPSLTCLYFIETNEGEECIRIMLVPFQSYCKPD